MDTIDLKKFNSLVEQTKLSEQNIAFAKRVLVDGERPIDVANASNIKPQRLSQIIATINNVEVNKMVKAVDASYAHAVKFAREFIDADAKILDPGKKNSFVGQIKFCSDLHVVQSLGRDEVAIHETAKLDKIPALGSNVTIAYKDGKGLVTEKVRDRGGQSR